MILAEKKRVVDAIEAGGYEWCLIVRERYMCARRGALQSVVSGGD